jgi:hypothetical protein
LLRDDAVTDLNPPALARLIIDFFNNSDEFVTGNNGTVNICRPRCVSPKFWCALVALHVTGANTDRFNADQRFSRSDRGEGDFLEGIVLWTMAHNCGGGGGHMALL